MFACFAIHIFVFKKWTDLCPEAQLVQNVDRAFRPAGGFELVQNVDRAFRPTGGGWPGLEGNGGEGWARGLEGRRGWPGIEGNRGAGRLEGWVTPL